MTDNCKLYFVTIDLIPENTLIDPIDIVLHAGAHKTATSHLQQIFERRHSELLSHGVSFYGPVTLRNRADRLRGLLGMLEGQDRDAALSRAAAGCSRMLISEENYIGFVLNADRTFNGPSIYPTGLNRILLMAQKMAPHRLHLAFSTRNPADFLTSCYSLSLMAGPYQTWEQFLNGMDFKQLKWTHFIRRIAKVPGVASITVWRYEDYHEVFDSILDALLGKNRPDIKCDLKRVVNAGLSVKAVNECKRLTQEGHVHNYGHDARKQFPVGVDSPCFQPWSDDQLEEARQSYDADMLALCDLEGINVV